MRFMQNSKNDKTHPEESPEAKLPAQTGEENSISSPSDPPETDPLAATQVHFPSPSEALAEDLTPQADPFAETRVVNVENRNTAAGEEILADTLPARVDQSEPIEAQTANSLAATLPTRLSATNDSTQGGNREPPDSTSLSPDNALQATQVVPLADVGSNQSPPDKPIRSHGKKPSTTLWVILIGILGLIGIAFLSAFAGYTTGINARKAAAATQAGLVAKEQYELALQEIAQKDFGRARQRLEYIIQIAPDFPGAAETLAEVIFEASITATPTTAPSPTVSPTPDLRSAKERLETAKQQIFNSQWQAAMDTLLLLRKAEPNFQPAVVDDLLYLAYRNSGRDKILKEANLEGGIYDLTLAEKIGPLDTETKGLQNWARLYLLGASYWDVDWGQVVYYFAQVAPAVPNLRDGSGWTATDRYRIALGKYAEQLLARKEWCAAMEMYQQALSYGGDQALQDGYNHAYEKCVRSQATPTEAAPPAEVPTETSQP